MSGRVRGLRWLVVALVGVVGWSAASGAERVALVMGNSRYEHAPSLNNPENDARAIAEMLSGLGFQVTGPLFNLRKAEMDNALKQFGRLARGADAAVVYFSGHGVEVNGKNYLIPKEARLEQESDASLETVALEVVLDQIAGASRYRLVILDACRDNPLANNMLRVNGTKAVYRGLAPIEPQSQTYIAYAARAGQQAQDGSVGGHSPYTAALLKYLPQPSLPLERVFGAVRDEVRRVTGSDQTPYLYGELGAQPIYLADSASNPQAEPPRSPWVDHDLIAWQSAEKCATAACFQAYLDDYPKGRYARMAQARLQPVPAPQPPAVVKPPVVAPLHPFEPEMVLIKKGCFQMGSPADEPERGDDERQHEVCIQADYEIGKYEVTQGQWQAVMGSNPSYFKQGDRYPVENVSWDDIKDYLVKLNRKTGKTYRLPTEAEWEYAARAGTTTPFWTGQCVTTAQANYDGNYGYGKPGCWAKTKGYLAKTQPVGTYPANPWGLYDTLGNVREWTCSRYTNGYNGSEQECIPSNTDDPFALRGGSWGDTPAWVRSAGRSGDPPSARVDYLGFRLARSL